MFVEPPAPLAPLLHNTTSLRQAVDGGTLGVGYAGGGFMLFYYIGVSKILQQLGVLKRGTYKTAGSSVGVLAQSVDHPGYVTHDIFIGTSIAFVKRCRAKRNCMQTLDQELMRLLKVIVRPGQSKVYNNSACATITTYGLRGGTVPRGVCTFADDDDLRATMRAGCYVPGWSGYDRSIPWHGLQAYDGAFDQLLPCPPNVTYCIKVAGLSPFDAKRYLAMLEPATALTNINDTLTAIREILGSNPWDVIQTSILRDTLGTLNIPNWIRLLTKASLPGADIYPGKYSKSPLTPLQQLLTIFTPPDESKLLTLYKLGQQDGAAWAREQGWVPEAPTANRTAAAAAGGAAAAEGAEEPLMPPEGTEGASGGAGSGFPAPGSGPQEDPGFQ